MTHIISHIQRSIDIRFAQNYFRIRSWWPVWFYIINKKNRNLFLARQRILSEVQKRIISDLMHDGIALAHIDELFPSSHLWEDCKKYVRDYTSCAETKTHKSFLKNLWDAIPTVDINNPFIPLALSDTILGAVNEYMQMWCHFFYLTLNITMPVPEGSKAVQSQRWHGDPEDKKMCKVFLYISDVDEQSGPFVYVRGTHYAGRWRHLFREQPPRGFLPPARPIDELVPADDIATMTGSAGTIIFCDTSGYHRGGYTTAKPRTMLTLGYCSSANPYPLRYQLSDEFNQHIANVALDPAARHALSFSRSAVTKHFFKALKPNFKYEA